jgi:DNA (cytosine-5)-methyltransferase 1
LRAGSGNFSPLRPIHYDDNRVITVRESARIQGFGDDFIWPDWIPRLQQYRQVGNAVPPPVAKALVTSLAKQCGWTLRPRSTKGDVRKRGPAITMELEHRVAERRKRLRGASLGKAGAS